MGCTRWTRTSIRCCWTSNEAAAAWESSQLQNPDERTRTAEIQSVERTEMATHVANTRAVRAAESLTPLHQVLPYGSQFRDTTSSAGHAWVNADIRDDEQVKNAVAQV